MLMGVLGGYYAWNGEWKNAVGVAAAFLVATLYQLVILLQAISDMIYDQTAIIAQDMFNEGEEFAHPDYPIEDDE